MEDYLNFLLPPRETYMDRMRVQHEERYAAKLDLWTHMPGDRRPARWLAEHAPPGPHHVLDIGTGRGLDLEPFLALGHRATGLDLLEIDNWPELRKRWGDQVALHATPFLSFKPSEPATLVTSVGSFHHQHPAEYDAFLAHVHEVLAPGGHFMLCVFHAKEEGPGILLYSDDRFWRFFTTAELRTILEKAGFRWVESFTFHESAFPSLVALVTH
ncbi:MAG: class I SAM-dependent methyltransferase [Polyangiaceae bacterium]|nr:class I SAM-dependent methyltransferase [Polyangiaceae bacterium]